MKSFSCHHFLRQFQIDKQRELEKEKTQLIIKVRLDKKAEDRAKDQKVAVGVEAGTRRKRGEGQEICRRNTTIIQVHSRNSE